MTPEALSSTLAAAATPSGPTRAPENPSGVLGQNEFLKIMIAQLKAQNPLEPGNANEFVNELAQLTQVEQTTNLANSSELSSAVSLIGRSVSYTDSAGATATGVVESVQSSASGTTVTVEHNGGVKLTAITEVQ